MYSPSFDPLPPLPEPLVPEGIPFHARFSFVKFRTLAETFFLLLLLMYLNARWLAVIP